MPVLITRPDEPGRILTEQLNLMGIPAHHFPLISITAPPTNSGLESALLAANIIIAVSQYAVSFTQQIVKSWPNTCQYFAIGSKTAQTLKQVTQNKVYTPRIHDSEHLLQLEQLNESQIKNLKIVILRGNGGRDLIYEQLTRRGAHVEYREVYQRKNIQFDSKSTITKWQDKLIQHIVITSSEQLNHLLSMCEEHKSWLLKCCLYVPSQRIASQAQAFGFNQIVCTEGASNAVITRALQAHIKENNNDQKEQ
ncbi:uroporphyrinogen-III synthase [Vibrio sp. FNV 38]|nr:uroporphyrinogen-III synthase [Vibrio sp. FNV 38]